MFGIACLCQYCGRPIVGSPMVLGNAGETYHEACTKPPVTTPGVGVTLTSEMIIGARRFEAGDYYIVRVDPVAPADPQF